MERSRRGGDHASYWEPSFDISRPSTPSGCSRRFPSKPLIDESDISVLRDESELLTVPRTAVTSQTTGLRKDRMEPVDRDVSLRSYVSARSGRVPLIAFAGSGPEVVRGAAAAGLLKGTKPRGGVPQEKSSLGSTNILATPSPPRAHRPVAQTSGQSRYLRDSRDRSGRTVQITERYRPPAFPCPLADKGPRRGYQELEDELELPGDHLWSDRTAGGTPRRTPASGTSRRKPAPLDLACDASRIPNAQTSPLSPTHPRHHRLPANPHQSYHPHEHRQSWYDSLSQKSPLASESSFNIADSSEESHTPAHVFCTIDRAFGRCIVL